GRVDAWGAPCTATLRAYYRVDRVVGVATRLARLRLKPNCDKRVAIVLSAYPSRRSRLGNAVGLDTPASVVDLLPAMAAAGYRVERLPDDGDDLMAELAGGPLDLGNVLLAVQPPRGFGEDPVAVYHSPDLPPTSD